MFYELEVILTDILTIIMLVILYETIRRIIKNKRNQDNEKGGVKNE